MYFNLINYLEAMSVWDLLQILRTVAIIVLSTTIAITLIFAVASPLPAAYYWYTSKNSDGQLAYPFFIGLTDNICWFTYGIYRRDWGIVAINVYCISMTTLYLTTMYVYRTNRNDMHRLILGWVTIVLIIQGYASQMEMNEAAVFFGRITTCVQTVGASGLIFLLYKILKAWRLDFLPFFPVAVGLTIETQVFTLGVLRQDRYMMMANGFFMTMNGILFSLFYILPANRQLVLPDLFTFIYDRVKDVLAWHEERKYRKKVPLYTPNTMTVDMNENIIV